MKKVIWVSDVSETWSHSHHFAFLVEDLTGISLNETMCPEIVKYMAKRLKETPYSQRFKSKYTIYQDEYQRLVEKFNTHADKNGKIEVR
jgi:hypothetical protein